MRRHTTSGAHHHISPATVHRLLDFMTSIGADPTALVHRAGLRLPRDQIRPGSLSRLPRDRFSAVYAQCVLTIEAHANNQNGRLSLDRNEYRMLCYCIISCGSLREVINRATEFLDMLTPRSGTLRLLEDGGKALLEMRTIRGRRTPSAFISDIIGLSTFHQLFGWLIGQPIELLEAQTLYDDSFEQWLFLSHFPVPLQFGAPANRFSFSAAVLDKPIIRDYHDLVKFLEIFPFDVDGPVYQTGSISDHVRTVYTNALLALEQAPSLDQLAGIANMSTSTFRRRLNDEGTSLRIIKEECRKTLATELLKRDDMTLPEIGPRLGFADVANFRRAFKSWFGVPPTKFRT